MNLGEAMKELRRTEAWRVFKEEWIEERKKNEQALVMQASQSHNEQLMSERAKGAFHVLNDMVASVELDLKPESEDNDV